MSPALTWSLLTLFSAHLAAAVFLGCRRRESYYLALTATFALIIAALLLELLLPDASLQGIAIFRIARVMAWLSAAVSISWTMRRLWRRTRS